LISPVVKQQLVEEHFYRYRAICFAKWFMMLTDVKKLQLVRYVLMATCRE